MTALSAGPTGPGSPGSPGSPGNAAPVGGVMAALVTPLTGSGDLDHHGLERLARHLLRAGVAGLCPAGSTGEGPLLSRDIRIELVKSVGAMVPSGVAVIPATVSTTVDSTVVDLEVYKEAGATAALVAPPFYYPLPSSSVLRFFEEVAERSPLPFLLYNIPAMTKITLSVPVVEELSKHPKIVGIKDSSRDLEYFQEVCLATEGHGSESFAVLTGSDTLLISSLAAGGAGTIAASVNLVPGLVMELYAATREERWSTARTLQVKLLAIVQACRRPGFPGGWKAALALAHLCGPHTASPINPATSQLSERLADELTALGVLPI